MSSSEVPESCPGTASENAGMAGPCAGCPNQKLCASGDANAPDPDLEVITEKMSNVGNIVFVLSGKGGVGKSSVTVNLAAALAGGDDGENDDDKDDGTIGILDGDLCGPSIATMLGVQDEQVHQTMTGWQPVPALEGALSIISTHFLIGSPDGALVWRGPKKNALLKQFLKDVDWTYDNLEWLLIDTPPGTSDEHLSLTQLLSKVPTVRGAVIVSTPQEISLLDVRKEITFCRKVNLPVIGVIENMAQLVCPHCSHVSTIFPQSSTQGGLLGMCKEMNVPFLGSIPLDPLIGKSCDAGVPFVCGHPESKATEAMNEIVNKVKQFCADASGKQ